jgi:exopolysaccharide biosynthesis polyprenyl glycosylphosphotransferase
MTKKLQASTYILADILSAILAWGCFFYLRKTYVEESYFVADQKFFLGLTFIPLFWLGMYYIAGNYTNVFKRHRLRDFGETAILSILGATLLFFVLLINDDYQSYRGYYTSYFILLGLHFTITLIPRLFFTSRLVKKIHQGEISFPTLIVGGNENALSIYNEIKGLKDSPGNQFTGFVSTNGVDRYLLEAPIEYFGAYDQVKEVIVKHNIVEVIIAVESSEHESIKRIIDDLSDCNVAIKVIPDMYDILSGSVKMTSIFGALLIEVNREIMPVWQQSLKRIIDVVMSLVAILILLPVFFILAILVKSTSKGAIFFNQERVGQFGEPFNIYKFRSMVTGAEKDGPQLSSSTDARITSIGKFMRKTRFDEIPQFFNVIKGDMSLVGPRPERQFYIDQIIEVAPHYKHLQKVKPGITSWGQVKYGYAENVDQMVARLKYDLLYVENRSLGLDAKILIYTVLIVLKGTGK